MADALQSALRDHDDLLSSAGKILVIGAIYWNSSLEPMDLGAVLVAVGVFILASWLAETYDLHVAVKSLTLAALATLYGAVLFVFDGAPPAVSVGLLVVGAWFLFDAVQAVRHDGLSADGGGHAVYRDSVARKVDYALRDEPRTERKLCEELDFDEGAVDDALATLDERGVLTREGSELRTSRTPVDEPGSIARVQRAVRRGASRLARPVTVELRG